MKHPVLENRTRLIVWGLVWLFISAGQAVSFNYGFGSFARVSIPDIIVSLIIYSGLALSVWYPFSYFSRGETKIVSNNKPGTDGSHNRYRLDPGNKAHNDPGSSSSE